MNKIIGFLLLFGFGFISFSVDAQEAIFKHSQSLIIIDLTTELIEEAELNGITNDRIYISFTMLTNCEIYDFKILRPAKLKSFNLVVEKEKEKIIKQLKNVFTCNHDKEQKFQTPIIINIGQ